ncbi:MAG: secondary thiamine-phosphate synthase enzyme YjbQ [Bacteroidota bacterium]|nr:secondary thiamine-phosphate synthase enzyme YjbQ [Candidatus Kapabacteria bacterium]MCX7937299.1 secondary thiamine-phosphate synthase enzyme YjbQ [Chlorobiota bacterium]MDW8075561.1 secondary thiamine-phosphate synthase enzyme YjbQ [Bacteroidota bacterium]MDW8271760.1 secondary thiamine-phosphate synthase enzyme YjbQ [Bacteroidota bacterium]
MTIIQRTITIEPHQRGIHCITGLIEKQLPELAQFRCGTAHLFLQHTSAALALGENTDPDVRADLNEHLERLVPDDLRLYRHALEGADDASSHIKSALIGVSLLLPVQNGRFALGRWQGIYLCEFRDHAPPRTIVATVMGQT